MSNAFVGVSFTSRNDCCYGTSTMSPSVYYIIIIGKDTISFVIIIIIIIIIIISGSAAQRGLWPPRPRGFLITHNDASESV
jgi:hypothetical protein